MSVPFFIVIAGPTSVGKTEFVEQLAHRLSFPIEVLNGDMGQFYTPLTIGTAKPDLAAQSVPQHLFNILDTPINFTVTQYHQAVLNCMNSVVGREAVPVIVGGSSFYLASLFYPPMAASQFNEPQEFTDDSSTTELWNLLSHIDPLRAQQIHKNDRYRIKRALHVWHEAGVLPSSVQPRFDPLGACALFFLTREREDLSERIHQRVDVMFNAGWLEEVQNLSLEWQEFLLTKKIIGYPEIILYLRQQELGELADDAHEMLIERISQRTRGYAKRQQTFWKRLKAQLLKSDPGLDIVRAINELNLTLSPFDLYLDQVVRQLEQLYSSLGNDIT